MAKMTSFRELADELAILFAADPFTYAKYVESIAVMEVTALDAMVQMSVATWVFRRRLKRILAEQQVWAYSQQR
jgi:hypothetical protein